MKRREKCIFKGKKVKGRGGGGGSGHDYVTLLSRGGKGVKIAKILIT